MPTAPSLTGHPAAAQSVRHSMKELSRARTLSTLGEIPVGTCSPR